jgi:zinc/manganese transport system permease protein
MDFEFSWNLLDDLRDMWSLPFMVNAYRAGTIVAVAAAIIGWFVTLRKETFAAHTVSLVGFPGAACALWLGLPVAYGYFGFSVLAAAVIAVASRQSARGLSDQAAVIGTTQAFALAAGMLFLSLFGGFLGNTTSLLFGTFLGITTSQVIQLAVVCALAVALVAATGRPLLFASIDPDTAQARGVPSRALAVCFLITLGATAAEVSQITGSLLVFALLVLPAATAQRLTDRIWLSVVLSVVFALAATWVSLFVAFYSPYPIGFWLTTFSFALYLATRGGAFLVSARRAHTTVAAYS